MSEGRHISSWAITAVLLSALAGAVPATETNTVTNSTIATEQRLQKTTLPVVKLENATLSEAVDFLRKEAAKNSPDGKGVQMEIDLRPSEPELKIPKGIDDDLRSEILKLFEGLRPLRNAETTNTFIYPRITLNLRDIPLYDALRLVTDLSGVWFVIRTNTVVIGRVYGEREARVYKLPQKLFDEHNKQTGKCFIDGYPEPLPQTMSFIPNRRLAIVINTTENLGVLENVLSQIDSSVEKYPSGEKLK